MPRRSPQDAILSGEVLAFWQAHGGEALLADSISGA
jgi:hypothetical protein